MIATASQSAIDGTGWALVALVAVGLVGAALYMLNLSEPVWEDEPAPEVEQEPGYRILGPVVRPPYDWQRDPSYLWNEGVMSRDQLVARMAEALDLPTDVVTGLAVSDHPWKVDQ